MSVWAWLGIGALGLLLFGTLAMLFVLGPGKRLASVTVGPKQPFRLELVVRSEKPHALWLRSFWEGPSAELDSQEAPPALAVETRVQLTPPAAAHDYRSAAGQEVHTEAIDPVRLGYSLETLHERASFRGTYLVCRVPGLPLESRITVEGRVTAAQSELESQSRSSPLERYREFELFLAHEVAQALTARLWKVPWIRRS